MNKETAQKLKDLGFPQEGKGEHFEPEESIKSRESMNTVQSVGTYLTNRVYLPTLSELIEAVNPMKADEFSVGTGAVLAWEALLNYHGHFDYPDKFKDGEGFVSVELREEGSTPEEAVANLWLALNSKK